MFPAFLIVLQLAGAVSPRSGCGAVEHRQFDFWIGEWEVRGPQGRVAGYSRISPMLQGCAIREEWTSADGRVLGESYNVYDASDRRWHQAWVDNSAKRLDLSGGLVERNMVMEQRNTTTTGAVVIQRITWSPLPDGRVRQLWQASRDGGATWTTSFDGFYSRRESGGATVPAPPAGQRP